MIKRLLTGLAVLVLLVVGGLAAAVYLADWNHYRDVIQDQAAKYTGRELQLNGELQPSFFPWAGISIADVRLGNAEGFGDTPFAEVAKADIKVELLPLLRRMINVSRVELHGVRLDLQRDADGRSNWDDLLERETSTEKVEGNTTTEVEGNSTTLAALAVGGIDIRDAELHWTDRQSGTDVVLDQFNLQTGEITLDAPFPLELGFHAGSAGMQLDAQVTGKGTVRLNLSDQHYLFQGADIALAATGASLPNGALKARLRGDLSAALAEQTAAINALTLNVGQAELDGSLVLSDLDTEPSFVANLNSDELPLRELLAELAAVQLETRDPEALKRAGLAIQASGRAGAINLDSLRLEFDDSVLNGTARLLPAAREGALPPLRFGLKLDQIDLDRYLAPAQEGEAQSTTASADDVPIALPMELLRGLDVDGQVDIGQFKLAGLTIDAAKLPLRAREGQLSSAPITAQLYGGSLEASSGLDARKTVPSYQSSLQLRTVDSETLLQDLLTGNSPLSGQVDARVELLTTGDTLNGLIAASQGSFSSDFSNGSVNGINLGYQVRRAQSLLAGKTIKDTASVQKTDFASLHIGGTISDGVVQSDDLDLRSPLLRVNGDGQVNLPDETIDYTLRTQFSATAQGQGGADMNTLKGLRIELPIRTSFSEMAANPAGVVVAGLKDSLASAVKGMAEERARAEAEKLKARAQDELKAREAQAREVLKAQEAKAREQIERQGEKLGEQVQDRLKGILGR